MKTRRLKIIFMLVCSFYCCTGRIQASSDIDNNNIERKEEVHPDMKIDTTGIAQKLTEKKVNQRIFFDKDTLSIPFHYSMKANNRSELSFLWQIGDLEIDSQSDNYFSFGFRDQIPYEKYDISAGNMHLVLTQDKEAVTLSKVKNQLTDIKDIYYQDNQSLIYRMGESVNVLFFEYQEDKKAFAVYFSSNHYFPFDITLEQKVELATNQLALAKQFFKIKNIHKASGWNEYEKNLNSLNVMTINESYEELRDTLKSQTFNEFIGLEKMPILVMNVKADNSKLWQDVRNFYSKKEINPHNNKFPNFEYIFKRDRVKKIEYMGADGIILRCNDLFDNLYYVTIVKTRIKNKETLLATKSLRTSVYGRPSKEMAYFYLNLFNHFGKL